MAWVLIIVPLLTFELGLIILNAPGMARTSAHSLAAQSHAVVAQFGRGNIPAGLVSVISAVLLVLPMAGICYILLLTGQRIIRRAVTASQRRPLLGCAFAATAVVLTAALAVHWGALPLGGGGATQAQSAAADTSRHRPPPARLQLRHPGQQPVAGVRPAPVTDPTVARDQAAAWVARHVSAGAILACDPAMCAALAAHGVAAGNLMVLRPGTGDPLDSDVVLATAAVRGMFGAHLAGVYAPERLASFGTGAARVDVRIVAPDGAAAYRAALAADVAARQAAGAQLLRDSRVTVSPSARAALAAGQVDARLLITLAALAASEPVQITGFGGGGPDASPGLPLRTAELTAPAATARTMLAFVRAQRTPYLPAHAALTQGTGGAGADRRVRRARPARPDPDQ